MSTDAGARMRAGALQRPNPTVARAALLLAALLASVAMASATTGFVDPPAARGAMGGSSAQGNPSTGGFSGPSSSISFEATRTSSGSVSGWFSGSMGSGTVTCLAASGSSAVVGGMTNPGGPGSPMYVVFFVDDGGPNPADDTLHINAASNVSSPTCTETPDGTPAPLTSGNVIVDDGTAGWTGAASVDGSGSSAVGGSGSRTFSVDVDRDAGGTLSGSFSWNESSGWSGTATPTCLRVIGNRAILGGQLMGPPLGVSYVYWVLTGGGPGSGGSLGVMGFGQEPECTEVTPTPDLLTSGSIALTGGGSGGGEVSVAIDAFIERAPFQGDRVSVAAVRNASGIVGGQFSYSTFGGSVASGQVTCVASAGADVVVGGRQPSFSGNPELWVTIWAHDGDRDGTADTFAASGPTSTGPADCDAPSPAQESITSGQVTVLDGPSDTGTVDADGTSSMGFGSGTRTFDVIATRATDGTSSGTIVINEGGFGWSGDVRCVDIRGSDALVIGERAAHLGTPRFAIFFVTDGDPGGVAGAGDSIAFNTYTDQEPVDCVAARTGQEEPLSSGDIAIGTTPPPPPPPTTGSLTLASYLENGGLLAGVRYDVSGPNGFAVNVGDGDALDLEPATAVIRLGDLEPGSYTVCVATKPAQHYELFPGCDPVTVTTSTTPPAFLNTEFRFVVDLAIPNLDLPDSGDTPVWGVYEKSFGLTRSYSTGIVFDKRFIEVTVTFTAPSGAQTTVPAFWTQDYAVQSGTGIGFGQSYVLAPGATEPGIWRVRFSPDEVGTYSYTIRAQDRNSIGGMTYTSPSRSFAATAAETAGQVELDPRDGRFLRYADGTPYYPLGHNVAFEDAVPLIDGTYYYEVHYDSLQAAGENWTRLWMTDFTRNAIEWSIGHFSGFYEGPGRYSLKSAWRVDEFLQLAAERDIQVQLVLNDHGQFSTWTDARWAASGPGNPGNPYSQANGGPVPASSPQQFFTNPEAKRLFKQRLDYLVARYGAYRNVLAWELFNEVQYVGTAAVNPLNNAALGADIRAWHLEMAAYLRSIDPYDHLITTSSTAPYLDTIWSTPNFDLVQVHDYGDAATTTDRFAGYVDTFHASSGKPVILGEFGPGGIEVCGFDPTTSPLPAATVEHLAAGTHLHNGAWSTAILGSSAAYWWWGCYLHEDAAKHRTSPGFPLNEQVYPALRAYLDGEDLAGLDLDRSSITGPASVKAYGLDNGSRGFAWVRDTANELGTGARPGDLDGRTLAGIELQFAGFAGADGTTYAVEVWSPYGTGGRTSTVFGTVNGGDLVVTLPDFTRDVALKIRPGGSSPSATLPPGGTLTAQASDLAASVTTPDGGPVSIAVTNDPTPPPSGYGIVGTAFAISAPDATAADPLTIAFTIDAAAIPPGDNEATIAVFRNGIAVPACTGPAGQASPDPCVTSREALAGGDARIVVLTSQASDWTAGVPAPSLGAITGVTGPVPMGTQVTLSAPLSDAGSLGGHTATWDWADGTTSAGSIGAVSGGSAPVSGTRTYSAPGVYEVTLTVTDPSGQNAVAGFRYVVIYDPSAGFATGGGTITPGGSTSSPGDVLPGLDGTSPAEFGFVVKYKKGATEVPGGNLTFRYAVGDFELASSSFQWLVVTNDNWARFQGQATITGRTEVYPFRVDARDSNKSGTPDAFTIRIWAPGADPATAEPIYKASGNVQGQVTIHRK